MDADLPYFVGFSSFPGIGPVRFKLLYDYFGSAREAWESPPSALLSTGLGTKLCDAFCTFRKSADPDRILDDLIRHRVTALALSDPRYPPLLKEISDAPFVLYVKGRRGKAPINLTRTIGMVGARKVSGYGAEVTEKIASDLALAGCTIISGMAYGVDAVAHSAALAAGGATIAVLGCGVDVIAPPSNSALYQTIIECGRGAVVSEMPLGFRPSKGLFPARNRIISGLSLGVVVTEGAENSGSLITARCAAEQGREVFAVPGAITNPNSSGPFRLLKNGATPVATADDILTSLGLSEGGILRQDSLPALSKEEGLIYNYLSSERRHIDAIVRELNLTVPEAAGILTVLEMRGLVRDYGDKLYGVV